MIRRAPFKLILVALAAAAVAAAGTWCVAETFASRRTVAALTAEVRALKGERSQGERSRNRAAAHLVTPALSGEAPSAGTAVTRPAEETPAEQDAREERLMGEFKEKKQRYQVRLDQLARSGSPGPQFGQEIRQSVAEVEQANRTGKLPLAVKSLDCGSHICRVELHGPVTAEMQHRVLRTVAGGKAAYASRRTPEQLVVYVAARDTEFPAIDN